MGQVRAYVLPRITGTSRVWIAEVDISVENANGKVLYSRQFKGEAVKHPDDKSRDRIGAELALGRAMEAAGKRLQNIAWAQVPIHEDEIIKDGRVLSKNHPSMNKGNSIIAIADKKNKIGHKKSK